MTSDWTSPKFSFFVEKYWNTTCKIGVDPLPHLPILGSSNSATNKDLILKIWTNEDTII